MFPRSNLKHAHTIRQDAIERNAPPRDLSHVISWSGRYKQNSDHGTTTKDTALKSGHCWRWSPVYSYENCSMAHEAKVARLPGNKITWVTSSLASWIEIQWFNLATLLDFPNFTGPDGSNYDSHTSHSAGVMTLQKKVYTAEGISLKFCSSL